MYSLGIVTVTPHSVMIFEKWVVIAFLNALDNGLRKQINLTFHQSKYNYFEYYGTVHVYNVSN